MSAFRIMSALRLELRSGSIRGRRVVAGALFLLLVIFLAPISQVATASPAETCIQPNQSCTSWDPSSGPAATEVHIRGWNWSPSSAGNTSQIAWGFAPDKVVGTITISGDGTFSETIKLPDNAPAGETTIDVDGDFTLGRPLHFEVTQSSSRSAELDGPSFIYPKNGQTLDYEGAYLFKVKPVPGASGYLWGFFQGGEMVWENYRNERKLSGTEYGIQPGTSAHKKFVKGKVAVWVRGLVNGKWTDPTIITVRLKPRQAPPAGTPRQKNGDQKNIPEWAGWSAHNTQPKANTYAQGAWIIPHLDCSEGPKKKITRAAIWVGLWGDNSNQEKNWLPQIGTQSQCFHGQVRHFGVYQVMHSDPIGRWLPPDPGGYIGGGTPPKEILSISLEEGDRVTAKVVSLGKSRHGRLRFELILEKGGSGSQDTFEYVWYSPGHVLERDVAARGGCILENNGNPGGLAKFSKSVKIEQCRRDDKAVTMADRRYNMVLDNGKPLAETGDIAADGSFEISWKSWN
jgi:hypothetical protein